MLFYISGVIGFILVLIFFVLKIKAFSDLGEFRVIERIGLVSFVLFACVVVGVCIGFFTVVLVTLCEEHDVVFTDWEVVNQYNVETPNENDIVKSLNQSNLDVMCIDSLNKIVNIKVPTGQLSVYKNQPSNYLIEYHSDVIGYNSQLNQWLLGSSTDVTPDQKVKYEIYLK